MISEFLTHTPQTKRVLAEKTGASEREIELAVQQARREGAAIISSSDGYALSSDPAVVRQCAERLRRRLRTQYATVRAMQQTARRMAARQLEQATLWEEAA